VVGPRRSRKVSTAAWNVNSISIIRAARLSMVRKVVKKLHEGRIPLS
jgi:hypothetical protein